MTPINLASGLWLVLRRRAEREQWKLDTKLNAVDIFECGTSSWLNTYLYIFYVDLWDQSLGGKYSKGLVSTPPHWRKPIVDFVGVQLYLPAM